MNISVVPVGNVLISASDLWWPILDFDYGMLNFSIKTLISSTWLLKRDSRMLSQAPQPLASSISGWWDGQTSPTRGQAEIGTTMAVTCPEAHDTPGLHGGAGWSQLQSMVKLQQKIRWEQEWAGVVVLVLPRCWMSLFKRRIYICVYIYMPYNIGYVHCVCLFFCSLQVLYLILMAAVLYSDVFSRIMLRWPVVFNTIVTFFPDLCSFCEILVSPCATWPPNHLSLQFLKCLLHYRN